MSLSGFVAFLCICHVIGFPFSLWTFTARAGGSFWHGIPASQLFMSPEWFVTSLAKALVWELTLALWLAAGRPTSRWGVPRDSRTGRIVRVRPADD